MKRIGKVTSSGYSSGTGSASYSARIQFTDGEAYLRLKNGQSVIKVIDGVVYEVEERMPPFTFHERHLLADPTSWQSNCAECVAARHLEPK